MLIFLKTCPKCKRELESSAFGVDAHQSDGLRSWCKACHNADRHTYQRRMREKYRTLGPVWRPETKRCPACRQFKPRAEFPANRSAPDGLYGYCRPCWNAYQNARNALKREREQERGVK